VLIVWSSVLMAGASIDTTTLSCAAEILSTASALTVSLPFKTMSVVSFLLIPGAAIVTLYVPGLSPNIS